MPDNIPAGIPTELLIKIRNLLDARERVQNAIHEAGQIPAAQELDWVQALANEAATRGLNIDGIVSKHKESKAGAERQQEKEAALQFFYDALGKHLESYKSNHPEVVVYLLKEKVRQLSQSRDAHEKDKGSLNERLERLLLEIKELERPASGAAKVKS